MKEKSRPIKDLPEVDKIARRICARHGDRPDLLLEIFRDLQDEVGFVPEAAIPVIAQAINRSRAEVYGVVSFYHDFRHHPAGRHIVKVCRAESCQAQGGNALGRRAEATLGCGWGETTGDGLITLEAVYCLGNCALSPAIMVDERLHGRVDGRRFDEIIEGLRAEAAE
jgi:formate dehydrogenase subunit gamma